MKRRPLTPLSLLALLAVPARAAHDRALGAPARLANDTLRGEAVAFDRIKF